MTRPSVSLFLEKLDKHLASFGNRNIWPEELQQELMAHIKHADGLQSLLIEKTEAIECELQNTIAEKKAVIDKFQKQKNENLH